MNILQSIVASTLLYSAPYIFASLGGTFSERGGIVNVGLEGIMMMGAFSATMFDLFFHVSLGALTPWFGILFGALIGIVFSLLHAVATITFRADHIVSGTVINLMAPALSIFLLKAFDNGQGNVNLFQTMGYWDFPGLSKIPVIGQIFFTQTRIIGFVAILVAIIAWFVIFKTRFGLRLRAVGENPQAADTLGINVVAYRYSGVLISGMLGGIGGAVYAVACSGNFSPTTIAGQGFISMAAMIFGKWNPIGALLASIFFGFSTILSINSSIIPGINQVPQQFLQMAPYVVTIVVLAIFLGKAVAPKADGVNYIKSK
ncbi:ABC transporter permease [Lactovum miscens]|uniref:Simple sugar transport system permease protein n=1 Tax=Lactovum miscens TaxID=190387 RepID=A0A841CB78_9LACT|nr:ABC transporter permease [Lactovum miscens]MBB5888649.1 simple sugar transport system permease protein [Lactovum miscens]